MDEKFSRRSVIRNASASAVGVTLISSKSAASNDNSEKGINKSLEVYNNSDRRNSVTLSVSDQNGNKKQIEQIELKGRNNPNAQPEEARYRGDIKANSSGEYRVWAKLDGQEDYTDVDINEQGIVDSESVAVYINPDRSIEIISGMA